MNRERIKISQDVAAAIAQEMRNPVFGIASAAQLLRYRVADDPVMEKNIGRIVREAERLNTLITALVDYGRPAPLQTDPVDPDSIWSQVLSRHRGLLESKAILVHHTPAEPRVICDIDVEQFSQACSSALTNAVDAVDEGSDLTIVSSTSDDGDWQSRLHNGGPPISDDVLPRLFEPLVTTKSGHAGLGLAAAHRIVSEHGGTIAITSDAESGTTLTLTLPAARLP